MKKRTHYIIILSILLIALLPCFSIAQLPPDPSPCDVDPLDPACPIDGGLAILVAAGASLVFLRNKRK